MTARYFALLAVCMFSVPVAAADWPQWRGPDRDGTSKETGLLKKWPASGPTLAWKATDIGSGYSTPSVVGDRIYVISNRGNDEYAIALDAADGKQVWSVKIGKVGKNNGPQYPGARSTPTVEADALYCLSSDGDLVCLERGKGAIRWEKSLRKDFGGSPGKWAYAESPLIDGDTLVCTPGGAKATIVALNKKTGAVIWQSSVPGGDPSAYASANIGLVGGGKQYIQFLQNGVVGVDAKTGKFLWRYGKTAEGSPANNPTPTVHDGIVFSSSGKGGGGAVKLTAGNDGVSAKEIYYSKELANPMGSMVRVGAHMYGTNGTSLLCVEFATGKVVWQDRSVGKGSICYADGSLYLRGENGDVALVTATPDGYKENGRFSQGKSTKDPTWPYPVIANGRLYLRDHAVLSCYAVK